MSVIKLLLYAVISFGCSVIFFNSSILATIFIFLGLNCISATSKEEFVIFRKREMPKYGVLILGCLIGILLIAIGKEVVFKDGLIILGEMLFAPTVSVLIILEVCNLTGYLINKLKQKNN